MFKCFDGSFVNAPTAMTLDYPSATVVSRFIEGNPYEEKFLNHYGSVLIFENGLPEATAAAPAKTLWPRISMVISDLY